MADTNHIRETAINHIIEAIDHCLEDWAVSSDAMRWKPKIDKADDWPKVDDGWQTLGFFTQPMTVTRSAPEPVLTSEQHRELLDSYLDAIQQMTVLYHIPTHYIIWPDELS